MPQSVSNAAQVSNDSHSIDGTRRITSGSLRPIRPLDLDLRHAGQLISDPDWWLQESYQGQHLLIRKTSEAVEGIDGSGSVVPLPDAVKRSAAKIRFRWVMEGACVGDTFTVFDLPQFEMLEFRSLPFSVRITALQNLLEVRNDHLRIAETATEFAIKVQMLQRLRAEGKRGIVLKKLNGVSRRGGMAVDGHLLQSLFAPMRSGLTAAPDPVPRLRDR